MCFRYGRASQILDLSGAREKTGSGQLTEDPRHGDCQKERTLAKKPGPGRCVHCLQEFDIRNWDHVLPRSWYPSSTPENMEKWQIPTCKKCNSELGIIEEELLVMLALTVTPYTHRSSGIYERALRSIDESLGKDQRDRRARKARRDRVTGMMLHGLDIPNDGIYPNLGERWNRPISEQVALTIPAEHIRRFCEKIVRGVVFIESGTLICDPFGVEFFALDDQGDNPIRDILEQHGRRYVRGPGLEILRVVPPDEPRASIFKITIFGEFVMYATVMPRHTE